ncbi:hypothetical protein IAU60_001176 [Kwoniella sp. DSM 27419]
MTYDLPSIAGITKVAVIGAGAAGLAQIQQLYEAWARDGVEARSKLELVVYESKEEVGGVWLSTDEPKHAIRRHLPSETLRDKGEEVYSYPARGENPSPMYQGLRTNLTHDLMSYRGHPFPEGTALFPDRAVIQKYLESFADSYDLRQDVRFGTRVERVYLTPSGSGGKSPRRWTIESASVSGGDRRVDEYDFVSVANGHYSDGWIPSIPGLSTYPGEIVHSRFFARGADYAGKSVLVVGSFASGGDISRLIASVNIDRYTPDGRPLDREGSSVDSDAHGPGFTKVWVSSSGPTTHSASTDGPWAPFIRNVPLISHIDPPSAGHPGGLIHFQSAPRADGQGDEEKDVEPLDAPEVIIFATGYNFNYPFFKPTDRPWSRDEHDVVDGVVRPGEREGGDEWEEGGLKGQGMRGLDELLLFLKGDRTIAFPVLAYQVVPFPLAQVQARLISLLWAGLLPSFPAHPKLPPNPSNPYSKTTDAEGSTSQPEPQQNVQPRKVVQKMRELVFGAQYEWVYSEFLMGLCAEADEAGKVPEYWRRTEGWRRARREDTTLRKRTLGY